ncbi:hypothetical protein GEV41_23905 [Pseudomonas putida]|nr:hypothetical protein CQW32_25400 [Pseudomonas putida]PKF28312.1 hypothetical protein CW309_02605 [Pseudomonas hunanensis]QKL09288.1 hypothetical protein GEV41_23905 [Pseudomonas putida]
MPANQATRCLPPALPVFAGKPAPTGCLRHVRIGVPLPKAPFSCPPVLLPLARRMRALSFSTC